MPFRFRVLVIAPLLLAGTGGCNLVVLPDNIDADPRPARALVTETSAAAMYSEDEMPGAFWLEADRVTEPGRVGGYLSDPPDPRAALVIVLGGASSYDPLGPLGVTRYTHDFYEPKFTEHGFRIWTLMRRECYTPYGQDDLRDLVEALDWLDREGRAWLGVERVYLYGYSTGATIATLANRQRTVTAVITLGGLTEPDQFYKFRTLYEMIVSIYPRNTGICQLRATLEEYGPSNAPGWQTLNTVDHLDELRSPELFVQGSDDIVYAPENLLDARARYEQLVRQGVPLAPLEFIYLSGMDHFELARDAGVFDRTIEFMMRFEGTQK